MKVVLGSLITISFLSPFHHTHLFIISHVLLSITHILFIQHSFLPSRLLLLLWPPLFVVGHFWSLFVLFPFAIHSWFDSSCATGRPVQHGRALTWCITTFWINPVWTLWAAVAASPGQRPRRTYQRTRIMTVYGRLTVTGWALFLVRAPTSPTKTKPSPHSSCF